MTDLWIVTRVAMVCMMTVLILGTYYDALTYTPKAKQVEVVECSKTIVNMAHKLNVTLVGECEVVR